MKYLLFVFTLIFSFSAFSQESEEKAIKASLQTFFEAITEQDSVKFKEVMDMRGQLYYTSVKENPSKYGMSSFQKAMDRFDTSKSFIERPFNYDIKIQKQMAMAWVTYEFIVDGKFSHCGVDVFTLFKDGERWKIVNVGFTNEKEGCDEMWKVE